MSKQAKATANQTATATKKTAQRAQKPAKASSPLVPQRVSGSKALVAAGSPVRGNNTRYLALPLPESIATPLQTSLNGKKTLDPGISTVTSTNGVIELSQYRPSALDLFNARAKDVTSKNKKTPTPRASKEIQNGVTKPGKGKCRDVWDYLDKMVAMEILPSIKAVKEHSDSQGWNTTNTTVEYYNWRKFHGIKGRV